jgi:hypothetical protein
MRGNLFMIYQQWAQLSASLALLCSLSQLVSSVFVMVWYTLVQCVFLCDTYVTSDLLEVSAKIST